MAALGSLSLGGPKESGAAFPLEAPPSFDLEFDLEAGWKAKISKGVRAVWVGTPAKLAPTEAHQKGFEKAHMALDMYSATGRGDLAIPHNLKEWFLIGFENDKRILHYTSISGLRIETSVQIRIRRRDGTEAVPELYPPPPTWHPCLRYLREALLPEDPFEAFRKLWLAFEELLSSIVPKGRLSERAWLERALADVERKGVELGKSMNVTNGRQHLLDVTYGRIRCGIFHSKADKPRLVVRSLKNERDITEEFERLIALMHAALGTIFGIRRTGGVVTHAGFQANLKAAFSSPHVLVSSEAATIDPSETLSDAIWLGATSLTSSPTTEGRGGLYVVTQQSPVEDLSDHQTIQRIGLASDKTLFTAARPEHPLSLSNIDTFRASVGTRLVNPGQPAIS